MIIAKISTLVTYLFYFASGIILWCILNGSYSFFEWYHSGNLPLKEKYEYIIVGTGTAGSTIAAGTHNKDVLILEAGSMRPGFMDIPLLQPMLQRTRYDWHYQTEPQDVACMALKNRISFWPMGKVFGGTDVFNNMIYYRAERADFSEWFNGVDLDVFMNGFQNETDVEELSFKTDLGKAFIKAAGEAGLEEHLFYRPKVSTNKGRRYTRSHRYFESQSKHEIIFNAFVTKITFENRRATGVVIRKHNKNIHVTASKGIILAAGTIGSAKILLQSGVGPRKHLEEMGIPKIVDLKVGENLQDHITTGMDLVLLPDHLPLRPWDLVNPLNIGKYLFGDGINSSLAFGGCECLGFVNLNSNFTHSLGFMVLPVGITIDTGYHLRKLINLRDEVWSIYFEPLIKHGQQSVTILPILLHPKSKGIVRLSDSNPESNPLIQPNYLHEKDDIQILITGLKILQQILDQPAMRTLGAEMNPKPFPGCEQHPFGSDLYWECYIRALTLTLYHPIGTCRMGSENDSSAVVSNKDFKVHLLDNLYVVDASIMPNLPSGNPNSVVIALAKYFLKVKFSVQ